MKYTDSQIFDAVINRYSGYAERNDTLEAFIYYVDTLGGTLLVGDMSIQESWTIATNKSCSIVYDNDSKEKHRFPLKDIFHHIKSKQLLLF